MRANIVMELLPWHEQQWRGLVSRWREGSLPHALLLAGAPGLGKFDFARHFVQALLCEHPNEAGEPCGSCHGCHLYGAGTHPDINLVEPAEEGKAIVVDQVRGIIDYVTLKPHYAPFKITLIAPAERMNTAASNSLLKSLEEPPARSLMILVSHRPAALLPTIRSRCQRIDFKTPSADMARRWLQPRIQAGEDAAALLALAQGAPVAALAFSGTDVLSRRDGVLQDLERLQRGDEDVVAVAARWLKSGIKEPLTWMAGWAADMIRLKAAPQPPHLLNPDLAEPLCRLARCFEAKELHYTLDRTAEALRLADTPLNSQLLAEDVLAFWTSAINGGHRQP